MPTLAELTIAINSGSVREAKGALDDFFESGNKAEGMVKNLVATAISLIGIYKGMETLRDAFADAVNEDRVIVGLTNLTGKATQAKEIIEQLNQFSQSSQFSLPGLEEDARLLATIGVDGEKVVPTLKSVGFALEAMGAPATSLNQVVATLVRIREEGQLTRFTIQQLINAGLTNAGDILSKAYGMSVPDLETATRNGAVDPRNAIDVLIAKEGELKNTVRDVSQSLYVQFNELKNAAGGAFKDVVINLLTAISGKGGFDDALNLIRGVRAEIDDVFNTLAGGASKFGETKAVITVISALLRDVAAVLEVIVALNLIRWVLNLTTSLGGLAVILALIIGIDVTQWLVKSDSAFARFFKNRGNDFKEFAELSGVFLDTTGKMLGTIGSDWSGGHLSTPQGEKGLDSLYNKAAQDMGAIMDEANGKKPGTTPTPWTNMFSSSYAEAQKVIGGFLPASLDLKNGLFGMGSPAQFVQALMAHAKAVDQQVKQYETPDGATQIGPPTQVLAQMDQQIQKIHEETDAMLINASARKDYLEVQKMEMEIRKARGSPDSGWGKDEIAQLEAAQRQKEIMTQVDTLTKGLGNDFAKAFGEFVTGAKNAKDAARDFGKALEQLAVQQFVEKPIASGLNQLGNNLFKSLLGSGSGGGGNISYDPSSGGFNWFGSSSSGNVWGSNGIDLGSGGGFSGFNAASALGNVFWGGRLQPFASGGLVDGPTLFPMAGGMGLMGEAGPEAVMPLTRGPGGRLGVSAHGGAGTTINQNFNIRTNDADSFRRSERQIKQRFSGR